MSLNAVGLATEISINMTIDGKPLAIIILVITYFFLYPWCILTTGGRVHRCAFLRLTLLIGINVHALSHLAGETAS
jgi:hypothetical protein